MVTNIMKDTLMLVTFYFTTHQGMCLFVHVSGYISFATESQVILHDGPATANAILLQKTSWMLPIICHFNDSAIGMGHVVTAVF